MRLILISILLLTLHSLATAAPETARVSILSLLRPANVQLTLVSPQTAVLRSANHQFPVLSAKPIHIQAVNGRIQTESLSEEHVSLNCQGPCTARIQIGNDMDRVYSGQFEFYYFNNTINIVLSIPPEQLVRSLISSEMRGVTELEAVKAFAIVSRSFLNQNSRHPQLYANFCDTTHCQVFQNMDPGSEIQDAIQQTRGLVLTYHDQPLIPYYSRACGGRTSTFESAWGKSNGVYEFPSVPCPCAKHLELWKAVITQNELQTLSGFKASTMARSENKIVIANQNTKLQFPLEVFRAKLGQTYGWRRLPGNQYQLKQINSGYLFEGNSQGHGVGFCQKGAEILAAKGLRFDEILTNYFPGTEIRNQ
ncbi:MAG TPA: SpoIID/LytB domain-containing protein [Acidobacteriota bacterium]|nr:SpoIID/LytB domain-containing protein [Acidobacteriota bacterium]